MIYLDNAATTQMHESCLEIFKKFGIEQFYNPSALYSKSLSISNHIKDARVRFLKLLGGSNSDNFIFTSSGSQADNLALLCSLKTKKGKIIIGAVEHSAVYNSATELKARCFDLDICPCDNYGKTNLDCLEKMLTTDVVMVSIMHVCNETGAVNDLSSISKLIRQKSPQAIFHSDGVQAFGKIPVRVKSLGVDLYSISGHKINAPKGIGGLYISDKLHLKPIVFGGGQESNLISGTENVANIMAFDMASQLAMTNMKANYDKYIMLSTNLVEQLNNNFNNIKINTDLNNSCANIVSFCFDSIRGETLLHALEQKDIIVGTGSACSAKKLSKRIPQALGLDDRYSQGMLRVSFGKDNTISDVNELIKNLINVVEQLKNYQRG